MTFVCYHGTKPYNIDSTRADIVLKNILDPERRKIINCIRDKSKTVVQICKDTGLPISNVYRRIDELKENKLLIASATINSDTAKKEFLYKSKIRKVTILFDEDTFDVKIYSNLREYLE